MKPEYDLSKLMSRTNPHASKKLQRSVTMPYDVAAQLRSPEEMAAYLDAWLDEAPDDATGKARAVVDVARAKDIANTSRKPG